MRAFVCERDNSKKDLGRRMKFGMWPFNRNRRSVSNFVTNSSTGNLFACLCNHKKRNEIEE